MQIMSPSPSFLKYYYLVVAIILIRLYSTSTGDVSDTVDSSLMRKTTDSNNFVEA